jgi:hypothetical protein
MLTKKICINCNNEYIQKRGSEKYCSEKCYHEDWSGKPKYANRKRINKVCPVCKNEFETGGRVGKITQIFCSYNCMYKARYRHGSVCNKLNNLDCAYIAGFFDGEGSVIIYEHHKNANSFGIRTVITQSEKGLWILDWIKEITNIGSIVKKISYNFLHANSYTWQCNSEAAESLLLQILPYLKLKKEQALLALNFQGSLRKPELKSNRDWQVDNRTQMKILNQRGVQPTCTAEA